MVLYERALNLPGAAGGPVYERRWYGQALGKLGDGYAAPGNGEKASEFYERYIAMYKNADPPITRQVTEVKAKLAKQSGEPSPVTTSVKK